MSNFELAKKELYNKDKYLLNYLNCMFTKTNEIFHYENVPDTIDVQKMEYFIQKNGFVFFTKDGPDFVFYNGSLFDFDVYESPTKINAVLRNRSIQSYDLSKDGVLISNDFLNQGLEKVFKKYGVMLNECEITLYLNSVMNRVQHLITATDDKTKASADLFIEKIYKGDFSVIGSNAFFEGIQVNALDKNQNTTQQAIELTQYIKASAFNEIGLNSNFNLKRERLTATEIQVNESALKPFIQNMYDCRKKAIDKINEMYGLNIQVSLSQLWDNSTPKEMYQNDTENGGQDVQSDTDNKDTDNGQTDSKNIEETTKTADENTEETKKADDEEEKNIK